MAYPFTVRAIEDELARLAADHPDLCTRTVAPKWRSMFSVWSRVGSGSVTRVVPRAQSPASRQADFTCAEATGSV